MWLYNRQIFLYKKDRYFYIKKNTGKKFQKVREYLILQYLYYTAKL